MPPKLQAIPPAMSGSADTPGEASSSGSWKDRDPPPGYDGCHPDKTFHKWLTELKLWEFETEVPKVKRGVKILRQLSGSARAAAESLSFDEIACEQGQDNILKALREHFCPPHGDLHAEGFPGSNLWGD